MRFEMRADGEFRWLPDDGGKPIGVEEIGRLIAESMFAESASEITEDGKVTGRAWTFTPPPGPKERDN